MLDIFETPKRPSDPRAPRAAKKEIPKTLKSSRIPYFPQGKRYFPKSKRYLPKSKR